MNADVKPLVSIVVPSFNQGRFIGDTLRSIIGQDYPNLEIIVMDGGSTDETLDVVRSFGDRVQLISEPDDGQTDAINKGFGKARGEIVAWLNSDDIYLFKDSISYAVEQFRMHSEVDVLFGDYIRIDEHNRFLKAYRVRRKFNLNRLFRMCYISQPTVFFRSQVVSDQILDKSLNYGMDIDLWLKLGVAGKKFRHSGRYVAAERIHDDAKTVAYPERSATEGRLIRARYATSKELRHVLRRSWGDIFEMAYCRLMATATAFRCRTQRNTLVALDFRKSASPVKN
tara:strand:- start:18421 stop:19272 length:852 start_codon:yes stop_codon:yes gene_type:complete